MMTAIYIILLLISGTLLIKRIGPDYSWVETIGFGFPIGIGIITLLMLLMDWANIGLTATSIRAVSMLLIMISLIMTWGIKSQLWKSLKVNYSWNWLNMVWLVLIGILIYMEYANFTKTMYYPTYDRDSMAGFDTIGYVCAQEHTYRHMTIFDAGYIPKLHDAGSYISYMPMLQLAYAYVYLLGENTSKLIPALFYISFLIGFYGLLRRKVSHLGAALGTLGMFATPEMLSFSSLSNTNVIHACLASAGTIYLCLWFSDGKKQDLLLGSVLLGLNCWIRAEGIIFVLVALLLVGWRIVRTKEWTMVVPPAVALLPFPLFAAFAQANGLTSQNIIIAHPFWDGQKIADIAGGAWFLLLSRYYGYTFWIVPVITLINFKAIWKKLDNLHVLGVLLTTFMLYFVVLYQIDYIWDSLDNVINYSAKRFLFCYVPIAWFYTTTCRISRDFFAYAENKLSFVKKCD